MKRLLIFINLCLMALGASAQTTPKTIVLVHGAFGSALAWYKVVPLLKSKGYEVIAVTLPGHGPDTASYASLTMASYAHAVEKAIGQRQNVLLVGHSMGGMVISQVAEDIPGQIHELIYLTAFLPKSGEALADEIAKDSGVNLSQYMKTDEKSYSVNIDTSKFREIFAGDSSPAFVSFIVKSVKAEPSIPLQSKVVLTADRFGSVKKVYIYAINDKAISYQLQQAMAKQWQVSKVYSLTSSHTPMLSQPDQLAAIILQEAR